MNDYASLSQILITYIADGIESSKEDVLKIANEVTAKINTGEDFAVLAKEYSYDPLSRDDGGKYVNQSINSWISEVKQTIIDLPIKQISQPILTEYGYYIIRVDEKSTFTFEDEKDILMAPQIQKALQDFKTKELPGLIKSPHIK
jgi:foldase protein PrsA